MKFGHFNIHIDYKKAGVNMDYVTAGTPEKPSAGCRSTYEPHLDAYILDDQVEKLARKAVVICPGGGYAVTCEREAECIAMQYLAKGIQAFILWYSVKPALFPMALLELASSVKLVREHATEWNIDPNKIAVMGFSAGGHLAASLSTLWNKGFVAETLETTDDMIQPNGSILCYPVISSGEYGHQGSFNNLFEHRSPEEDELVSLEKQVDDKTPPTFIWSTWTDPVVPIENSLLYAMALKKHNVSCELHIYKEGEHGLSIATKEVCFDGRDKELVRPELQNWVDMSTTWLESL